MIFALTNPNLKYSLAMCLLGSKMVTLEFHDIHVYLSPLLVLNAVKVF